MNKSTHIFNLAKLKVPITNQEFQSQQLGGNLVRFFLPKRLSSYARH